MVPKTRCPVDAASMASSVVSRSLISPTRIMSGSSLRAPRKAGLEGAGVEPDFPVVDDAPLALMNKFDGIFDGDDVVFSGSVGHVHNGRKGG